MKVWVCEEWSEEHADIKAIYDSEEKAKEWEKKNPHQIPIHYDYSEYEVE